LQALINMMVVTALAPTKGIALPLISAGGTGWVLTALAIGVLAALERGQIYFPGSEKRSVPTPT
jgi:cell division protein FtsW